MRGLRGRIVYVVVLASLLGSASADDVVQQATVLYFTDAHQLTPVIDQLGERGGIARLATVVQRIRGAVPEAVLAFGGDLAGGVLFGAVFRGMPMVEALNRLDVDVATFGQHDFDFGVDQTASLVESSQFPWVTSNLVDESGDAFLGLPATLVLERQSIRIGFIGLTDAMGTTSRDDRVRQVDLIDAAKRAVARAKEQGVDVIVGLTQTSLATNERLLVEIPELDAILSEERSEIRSTAHFVGSRPILTPCGNLGSLTRLEIQIEGGAPPTLLGGTVSVGPLVPADPALLELEERYTTELEHRLSEPLADLELPLDAGVSADGASRFRETNAGNLIADAFRSHHDADIGLINGGGIRSNTPAGPFTLKEALSLLPYGNQVWLANMDGGLLRRVLEHGVSRVAQRSGAFCQVSGLRYAYDPKAPIGRRVGKASVSGRPVVASQTYSVALPGYLMEGGDGFAFLSEAEVLVGAAHAPVDVDVLADYVREQQRIHPRIENRISILQESQ